jgi:hypothetical protein
MNASFIDNKVAKDMETDKLKKNADEIATLLGSVNRNWFK